MKAIIVGCGRLGSLVAISLQERGYEVCVIDRDGDAFLRLGKDFSGETMVGSGLDETVLQSAGIREADIFMALTGNDNYNIMSAQIAKACFSVPRSIARVDDPIKAGIFKEVGIETICLTSIGLNLILEMISAGSMTP